jgi:hypothetical protein
VALDDLKIDNLKKDKRYGHKVPELWKKFKGHFSQEQLGAFDPLIQGLHDFDDIRSVDGFIRGASISIRWCASLIFGKAESPTSVPHSKLAVNEPDVVIKSLFHLSLMNVSDCVRGPSKRARHIRLLDNPAAADRGAGRTMLPADTAVVPTP